MADVVQCPGCGKRYRLHGEPGTAYDCKACGAAMVVPGKDDEDDALSPELRRAAEEFAREYAVARATKIPCPHCGEETLSEADFKARGPARPFECPRCRGRVRTNWSPFFVFLALLLVPAALVAVPLLDSKAKGLKYLPLGVALLMLPVAVRISKRFQRVVKA